MITPRRKNPINKRRDDIQSIKREWLIEDMQNQQRGGIYTVMATADGTSSTTDVEAFKKGVSDSIKFKYATLKGALEGSMESFAGEMYQAGLINREAMKSHNYDVIMSQFISGMDFKHTISELQEHYQLFTDVLEKLGGAAKMAANEFTKEWMW